MVGRISWLILMNILKAIATLQAGRVFNSELNPAWLKVGTNTVMWTIGPRPACALAGYPWNGFSVKDLEVQSNQ